MKKATLLLCALALTATGAMADQLDQNSQTVDGLTCEYWNDVHMNDGTYWPNWRIQFPDNDGKTYGDGAELTYTLTTVGGQKTATVNPSYFGDGALSFYSAEGVLAPGAASMKWSISFKNAEGTVTKTMNYEPVTFSVPDFSKLPQVVMTYTIENGDKTAYFNYTLTLKDIDKEVKSVRVWLDKAGNNMIGEATTMTGSIPVDVSAGNVQAWFKSEITFTDDSKMNGTPNDQPVWFERVSSIALPTIALAVGTPTPLTATTGTLPYTLTVTNPENVVDYTIWVVTTNPAGGDKAVSDVIKTTDLTGTINLYDLNSAAITNLWVKVEANMNDGTTAGFVQYPGAAEGYEGLSIDTTSVGVEAVEAAEAADVFAIDGRLVGRALTPAQISMLPKGLYITAGKKILVK